VPGRSSLRPYLARTGIEVIICTAAVHGCAELRRLSSVAQAVVKQPRVQAEQWAPTATACTCRRSRQTPLMYWGHQAEVETCEHGSGICGPPSDLLLRRMSALTRSSGRSTCWCRRCWPH